ncbi:MAG: response regulator [Bacteroidetes bacterium]|jgi:CheY-like chemotaxis protein|nr:response regulator [Bacteroidota bacterium]MBT6687909.1 response regulator [Bacteroidota bacterium]MBT7142443.1 response regulator [Bacteroidota bacterium]MBT7490050.1 response regulator [Bacteroidota bacterium]
MGNAKILVVEDEFLVAKDIQNSLKKRGYKVPVTIAYGEQVVEMMEKHNPDLILMDIMLKGEMTGTDAAIKVLEKRNIPLIFLTAYSDDNTISKAKLSQPYGYIVKPYKINELQTAIELALSKHKTDSTTKSESEKQYNLNHSDNPDNSIQLVSIPENEIVNILFSDIYYLESLQESTFIQSKEMSYIVKKPLTEIVTLLPYDEFANVRISMIVNIKKIFTIKYPDLIISDIMKVIPIEELYKADIENRMGMKF